MGKIEYKIIRKSEYKLLPWKNGKGTTKELLAYYNAKYKNYVWRISIAGVANDGEFSDFSGYDRYLIMLDGNGIKLDHGNGRESVLNEIYDAAHFSGSWKTYAKLRDGSIKDFNIMTLNDFCFSEIQAIKNEFNSEIFIDSSHFLIYSNTDDINITIKGKNIKIEKGDLIHFVNFSKFKINAAGRNIIAVKIFEKLQR